MEDLAYIYLALNHEIKRHQELKEERLRNSCLIWAPPIPIESDRDRATNSSPSPLDDTDLPNNGAAKTFVPNRQH